MSNAQAAFQRHLPSASPTMRPHTAGNGQPLAMLNYVCQWKPTKWKQLQQLHAATNQIHEVLMI
jgi:hypothetical protein